MSSKSSGGALRLVLGDQLAASLSALRDLDPAADTVLMAEVMEEATYVRHHKQKIALTFAAMRARAEALRAEGVTVRYVSIDDPDNSGSIAGEIGRAIDAVSPARVVRTASGEWRLEALLTAFEQTQRLPFEVREDDRFLCSRADFTQWAEGRKGLTMEWFYRMMRQRTDLLMDGDQPAGGVWNLDHDNRHGPAKGLRPPTNPRTPPSAATKAVLAQVAARFEGHFGSLEAFAWATTPQEAQAEFDWFLDHALPGFGQWQDTMMSGETWMWHAGISTSLHLGLLDPLAVCRAAEGRWRDGRAPLNAVEGFIRQIIGWREFVRGVYWLKMPEYGLRNALEADRALPWFYWSGETDMACVADVVDQVREHAYAHHIQRLMVTGNLAMLLGVAPAEINDWYMVVFADAYEWVELPNTHGMATFADGGIVGSKPYAASGAYINRMSNYCRGCRYDVKGRLQDDACPFNALYWDFLDRHEARLAASGRLLMPYKTLSRMDPEERRRIRAKAEATRQAMGAVPREA
ncbi:cryptochrome/photolyase family protein [Caulobacter sp. SLTY]|uniref:cryptochrome/photolyase family protein n=1 Tax=Caulobacter sp. SLTY TaxID=2683262 RepID=UPI001413584B|nr:cryptochrome/photolyase family protein [Caulobacter sp. SLTY]NBB15602.1 cryptochrome/photolyase family protein [Caulobacter sp. SLTY]